MKALTLSVLAGAFAGAAICPAATLGVSTYLRDGFSPSAIASDAQGNIYLAGSAVLDPAASSTGAVLMKVDPKASQYLYLVYFDSAASDTVTGITVDAAGNLYATGWTTNPNFPVVGDPAASAAQLGTPSTGQGDARSFVLKLDPQGAVIFAVLLGGSAESMAGAIALTAQGQIVISGETAGGFPVTPGAYSVSTGGPSPFLMELNPSASAVVFSATGIGGTSIALDGAGNIFVAGSTAGTSYPTTPGVYQTQFVQGHICYGLCQIGFDGVLQHLTKVDPTGSTLIYSTGINDTTGQAGSTTNTGLAVDAAGNAYVTGTLYQAQYPFTVTAPNSYSSFLTKLDPTGATVLYSVPIGGGGVQLDASGQVYVGGVAWGPQGNQPISDLEIAQTTPVPPPAPLSAIPQQCWPNNITANSGAYVMRLDPATGNTLDAQWIDGSAPGATAITLAGGMVWMTGTTPAPDVPFTPGVLSPSKLGPGPLAGAYLAAAEFPFAVPVILPGQVPTISCVLDNGNLTHVGAVAAFQLISVFGENLGPATGVSAPDGTDPSIAGVTVTFDGNPAQLLYVSSTQINVAVPAPPPAQVVGQLPTSRVMKISVNGAVIQRQFPFTVANLNLFANVVTSPVSCPAWAVVFQGGFLPVATNADGTLNSCANPAKYGSAISFYAEGVGAILLGIPPAPTLQEVQALVGNCSAAVPNASLINAFVYKVDVVLPSAAVPCALTYISGTGVTEETFTVTLSYGGAPVGPLSLPGVGSAVMFGAPGQSAPMTVWVTQ